MDPEEPVEQPTPRILMKRGTLALYIVFLAVSIVVTVWGMYFGNIDAAFVGLPMIVVMAVAVATDRRVIHIPPEMIVLAIVAFVLSVVGSNISRDSNEVIFLANFIAGLNLGLIGLVTVYALMKSAPGTRNESQLFVGFVALCVALASFTMVALLEYGISAVTDRFSMDLGQMMLESFALFVGAVVVILVYDIRSRRNVFGGVINSFLEENSDTLGMEEAERKDTLRLIEGGESEKLEFKSTLRTNLQTGEADKRMEKAVLKTIVAFVNTSGGELLIGVADDGEILGADEGSFDNRDKMGLHLSNIISAQIGSEFMPYIWFYNVDFGDKVVIRVKCRPCRRPVFLLEGKEEHFYIRRGPQSEELTGSKMIEYIENRRRTRLGKKGSARRPAGRCGGRDSNPRTSTDGILSPAPLSG